MRLVVFGIDLFAGVFSRLIADGHHIVRWYAARTDNRWNFTNEVRAMGRTHRIPIYFDRPILADLERLDACLLSAAYPYKIPTSPGLRGLNLHPTLLPEGRGAWPLPYIISRYPQYAGLTLHKLTPKWDQGAIVAQCPIQISDTDDLETLTARLRLAAPEFVSRTLGDFERLWLEAVPQQGGSRWKAPDLDMRTIDGRKTVAENLCIVRAFGNYESRVVLGNQRYCVTAASGWTASHPHAPGDVVLRQKNEVVLAVSDGFVVLRHYYRDRSCANWRALARKVLNALNDRRKYRPGKHGGVSDRDAGFPVRARHIALHDTPEFQPVGEHDLSAD